LRILIDIGHPAHVHLFKHFTHEMIRMGHQVHFTVREKESEIRLLEHEGFSYTSFGGHYHSGAGKTWGLLKFTWLMIRASLRFKPDIYLSHGSMYTAFASFFMRKPNIALEDTGNREQVRLYLPFTEAVLTSTCFPFSYGKKQVRYDGYHELAYLHPDHFTPDRSILKELGISGNERYFIVRFVSWGASHDIGQHGLNLNQKREIVELLLKYGKVFISSEKAVDPEFEKYRFNSPPERMHNALAFASLFVGEGATMASESAVLGVPSVYINTLQRSYTTEQQTKYGLVFNFTNGKGVPEKIRELLEDRGLNQRCHESGLRLLSEKIDVTSFLSWFIGSWPESFRVMKQDPAYQSHFKTT
jgi:uncharacterized protein